MSSELISLQQVVENGLCVGCGACAFLLQKEMSINSYGEYFPDISDFPEVGRGHKAALSCPSLHPEFNEDVLAGELFGKICAHDSRIGFNIASYAAYALEGKYRQNGTSGGMTTWIAAELLNKGLIDAVIHVKRVERKQKTDPYFRYGISRTVDEVRLNSKTRYHVVELSEVLSHVSISDGRYLFIGVPCLSKALRRLQKIDPVINSRIPFVISLVCGHFKSINWSISLAWSGGIFPQDSTSIQYRTKGNGIPARAYVFQAQSKSGVCVQKDSAGVVGGKFNAGAMMLPACDYCDDVVGETADLTVGEIGRAHV